MTRLNKIYSLIMDIHRTRPGRSKEDKIISLINYVEQINKDVKEIRNNLKHPYLNENKIIHALLEIQIQARLMQIGKSKSFQELAVYLFNIRVLVENTRNHLKVTDRAECNHRTASNEEKKICTTG
ncbi:hypothetical protein PC076_001331 [Salmonella enterica]|uniref:hypothetical protein n=1 Tax=Salmonella enterica TaxID=28901 RepID=UPI00126D57CA|nr:hypothetical protein [Salmonella enterica subsp. diarizonae]EHE8608864.1 hypothetical protein [Salmonella enterica subsp. enterica serovar 4,[5],12:b:-]EIX3161912.1 hypothetical protein [Salmonella enterica]ECI3368049.1 hypothetical protein [Salmonella enterica subsp. diarizonae]ECI4841617.1 hypothetical protein [Salmonella enterica subsp. diarizonae]